MKCSRRWPSGSWQIAMTRNVAGVIQQEDSGFSAENWQLLGELGLIAALFDAENGGLGIGAPGLATVFEALGYGLVVEPLAENAGVAGGLLAQHRARVSSRPNGCQSLVSGESASGASPSRTGGAA